MLFNSYAFIFIFLPLFLLCRQFFIRKSPEPAYGVSLTLLAFSLIFYAFWGFPFLLLCLIMVCGNYAFGHFLAEAAITKDGADEKTAKKILFYGLVFNLIPLLWFKYSWFFIQNIAILCNVAWEFTPPALPPGISFYTFIQIAWLVGVYRGQIKPEGIFRHGIFSIFFPWIISGPIVRYEQMGWQLENTHPATPETLAKGSALFCMGLAKKVILADSIGAYADIIFNAAEKAWPIGCGEAWFGSLCYTFQLYFDFSGYTDMAIGIGIMAGLRIPENFNSPYKATGIVDFWRRWHITLSSWLRDFLYIPLGGNRKGKARQYLNLFLTMLIGGAWHGAGWTYILWGAMHGAMLAINHFFRSLIKGRGYEKIMLFRPVGIFSILLTFFCLNFCWVVFRALSLDGALRIYTAMFSPPGLMNNADFSTAAGLANLWFPNNYIPGAQPFMLLALCMIICWFLPNTREILNGDGRGWKKLLIWQPTNMWAAVAGILAFVSLLLLSRQTTFLYFQF